MVIGYLSFVQYFLKLWSCLFPFECVSTSWFGKTAVMCALHIQYASQWSWPVSNCHANNEIQTFDYLWMAKKEHKGAESRLIMYYNISIDWRFGTWLFSWLGVTLTMAPIITDLLSLMINPAQDPFIRWKHKQQYSNVLFIWWHSYWKQFFFCSKDRFIYM